jgi:hypothetical protein
MKKIYISIICSILAITQVMAGNPDRIGQAGALQLNINGWGRTAGSGWSGVSTATGLEAMFFNLGGLAYSEKTELNLTSSQWLRGTDITINNFGFSQKLNNDGVFAISISSFNLGDIQITTVDQPDGTLGTYNPRQSNLTFGYSKRFTESISGGVAVKAFSEALPNLRSQGVAMDAGILYVTSSNADDKFKENNVRFGVSIRNIGPDAVYRGDGLSIKLVNPNNNDLETTVYQRSAKFNMPTSVNISAAYDIRLDKNDITYFHKLTPSLTFTNNAFARNQFTGAVNWAYKDILEIRGGFVYEEGIFDYIQRTNAHTGLVAGLSFTPPSKGASQFAFDFGYRHSNPFGGTYSAGVRFAILD